MSLLSGDPTTGQAEEGKKPEDNQNEDYVSVLVQEKGDQWENPQAIAKGYIHAQDRIKELEEKLKESDNQDYAKQLLEQVQQQKATPLAETPVVQTKSETGKEDTTPKPEDIERLISETLTKREQEATIKSNITKAEEMLTSAFGTEAAATLEKKSKELGLNREDLSGIAARSPSALMQLLGQPPKKENNSVLTSTVDTSGLGTQERNSEYYKNLRRTDRKKFLSIQVQSQMLQDRQRLGDKF